MPTLYTFFRSSASFRVRIALNLKGISYDPVVVGLPKGEQSGGDFMGVNPQGLVPAWVDENGVLAQSLAIIEYLDEKYSDAPLMPRDLIGRARVRALAQLVACEIHPLNNLRVLKYLKGPLEQTEDEVNVWYRHWVAQGLAMLERQLLTDTQTGRFMHGDTPGLADCFLVPQIFNAKRFDCDLTPYSRVMGIFDACMALPAFDLAQPMKQAEASLF